MLDESNAPIPLMPYTLHPIYEWAAHQVPLFERLPVVLQRTISCPTVVVLVSAINSYNIYKTFIIWSSIVKYTSKPNETKYKIRNKKSPNSKCISRRKHTSLNFLAFNLSQLYHLICTHSQLLQQFAVVGVAQKVAPVIIMINHANISFHLFDFDLLFFWIGWVMFDKTT